MTGRGNVVSVHIGMLGIVPTVLLTSVFASSLYLQEWAFESATDSDHIPPSCNPVKILSYVTTETPYLLKVGWLVAGVIFLCKHIFFASLYDRVYRGFLSRTACILRYLCAVLKFTESFSLVGFIFTATLSYPLKYTETAFYTFLTVSLFSMTVTLILEFCANYTRIKHRGYYNTGSLNCKLIAYLTLLGLWIIHWICQESCHGNDPSFAHSKEFCHNVTFTTSFLTLPIFLVFHGTDCLDFIKVRCAVKVPMMFGFKDSGYNALHLQSD